MVMYFTSEAEAREGERKEAPPELQAQMEEMNEVSVGETEFFDLKRPIIRSGGVIIGSTDTLGGGYG